MNKKGAVVFLLLICGGQQVASSGDSEKQEKMVTEKAIKEQITDFNEDDFFGDYASTETIKRTIPQSRSALSVFLMQRGLWCLMKIDNMYKRYYVWKKWVARWLYGKRKT